VSKIAFAGVPVLCSLAACSSTAQALDLNAILCDPSGWRYDKKLVSMSRQTKHVHGDGPGLLFEYTRSSKELFRRDGKFKNQAYRPVATKALAGLALSGYDRLSFWIYVEGNAEEAFQWGLGSMRPFRLSCRRGEWFHARWNLREAPVDPAKVRQIIFRGVNQGTPPGDPARARIYLSDFRLENAARRPHVGWAPDPQEIVLTYSGVCPGEDVIALAAAVHAGKTYGLTNRNATEQVSKPMESRRAKYAEIRIRAPESVGDYHLSIEDGPTATLRVRERPYEEAIRHALRAIRAQRCGCASELHGPCHLDDAIRSDTGKPIDVSGGWHDEGVSQYTHLTAQTMGNLARLKRSGHPGLGDVLMAEIEWGVQSVLKYELEPGVHYHGLVAPYWYHTDNRPGTGDERKINVFHPHQLSCWWRCEALAIAAQVCQDPTRIKARALAERYWRCHEQVDRLYTEAERARWQRDNGNLRVTAARLGASVEMFRLTGEREYADDAAQTAERLLTFQDQSEPDGLTGYFHASLGSDEPYTGVGAKSRDVPGRALAELLMALPDHPHTPRWREALRRYVEGTLKPLATLNAPYGYVAAGPFLAPRTTLFQGEKLGHLVVYPLQIVSRTRKGRELLRCDAARSQLKLATQMAAIGRALDDEELIRMAHGAIRFMLGANPFHVSFMRHFGKRWPVNAQLPNVPGMIVGWLGITSQGEPFFDPQGAGRLQGPERFVVKEGNTAMCGYLLEACSYLERSR